MKTETISIQFEEMVRNDGGLGSGYEIPQPVLVDMPTYCDVVFISGDAPDDGRPGEATLHITTSDKPGNGRTPTAFFVIEDGHDVPGLVIQNQSGPAGDSGRRGPIGDEDTNTYVRRVGKFQDDNGMLFFVFERLS